MGVNFMPDGANRDGAFKGKSREGDEKKVEWTTPVFGAGADKPGGSGKSAAVSAPLPGRNLGNVRKNVLKEIKAVQINKKISAAPAMAPPAKKANGKDALLGHQAAVEEEKEKRVRAAVSQNSSPAEPSSASAGLKDKIMEKIKSFFQKKPAGESNIPHTNLIKGETATFINWKENINFLLFSLLAVIIILAVLYFLLLLWQTKKENENLVYDEKIASLRADTVEAEKGIDEILVFEKKLDTISNLFKNHIYWTNFFNFLENNTVKNVYYESFSGDTSGKYILSAKTNNFQSIADQISVMKTSENAQEVFVGGGKASGGKKGEENEVGFSLSLSVSPDIFHK